MKTLSGMLLGKDGCLSSTKLLAFAGYFTFLALSIIIAVYRPDKFNYELFSLLAAASGASMRIADKWINVKSGSGGKSE